MKPLPRLPRQPVRSSNVKDVGYDPATQTLEVGFKSGASYRYAGVSPARYNELLNARSKGTFLRETIIPAHKAVRV